MVKHCKLKLFVNTVSWIENKIWYFYRAGVRLGEHDINKEIDCHPQNPDDCAPRVQDFAVEEVIPHPGYSSTKLENDIGLLRIRGTANMDSGLFKLESFSSSFL